MRTAAASCLCLGLVVGIPYYGMPYFYDYFEQAFGWSRAAIMLGLPVGTLVTLVAGPLFVRRLPPKPCIAVGAVVCGAALAGFGWMNGGLAAYYGLWLLYMTGWTFAGPLSHQVMLTRLYTANRGRAMAVAYFGISAFGAISVALLARPLTQAFGFRAALMTIGGLVALAGPLAWWTLPDVRAQERETARGERALGRAFWLLLAGSTISISGMGGLSQHLKLIFAEAGFGSQARLDAVFGWVLMLMLTAGSVGRFVFAWGADRFPKRHVISVAFVLMAGAMPLLFFVNHGPAAYVFAVVYGLGMSSDSLLVPLLAAEQFGGARVARTMGLILPVNTVGQTWFPYVVSLLWEATGSYTAPLAAIFGCILLGRLTLALLPGGKARESDMIAA